MPPKRTISPKKGIEFVHKALACSGTTVQKAEIKLGLLDDEMAQILQIDSTIQPDNTHVTTLSPVGMFLSLDPDSEENPLSDTDLEDLEIFYQHRQGDVGANIAGGESHKIENFDPPINVGTNVGMTVNAATAANVAKATVSIYFRRVKASDVELAKILLKRR